MSKLNERSGSRSRTSSPDKSQVIQLKMQQQEIDYKKEIAILSQKIELLSIQLKDSKEREESTKRLHDTMLSVFNRHSSTDFTENSEDIHNLILEYGNTLFYMFKFY
jgi:hypothetical protein